MMDTQNERMRWMYTAGVKRDGRREGRGKKGESGVKRGRWEGRAGHREGIEKQIDGSDGRNKEGGGRIKGR